MQALFDAITRMPLPLDALRIFHGRGGLHPGCEHLSLDAYPPVWLVTSHQPMSDSDLLHLHQALQARWQQLAPGQMLNWVFQCRHDGRAETRVMSGEVPQAHVVTERGTQFKVHLLKGQNHGLFLDMAEGRQWVHDHALRHPGIRVLNLFAYTCAFSVRALQAGARQVINIDMSQSALATGQKNHQLNGLMAGASFLPHDIFSSWGKLNRSAPYDLVVVDPPSHQKGSFVAEKDYPRLMRRLSDLLSPDGHAMLCLNAPELSPDFLQNAMQMHAPSLIHVDRLANPAAFADQSSERSLKVLIYRAPSDSVVAPQEA